MSENIELIKRLGTRFIQRKDVKAIQHSNGTWMPVREKFTLEDFDDHFAGYKTFGHYMVDQNNMTKLFAFDIDIKKYKLDEFGQPKWETTTYWKDDQGQVHYEDLRAAWLQDDHPAKAEIRTQLRCLAEGLAMRVQRHLQIQVAIADSGGKGLHVYAFAADEGESIEAGEARQAARLILDSFGCFEPTRGENFFQHTGFPGIEGHPYFNFEIEIFPKQDSIDGKDLGNLMKLPLGLNRKTGNWSNFIMTRNGYNQEWQRMEPMKALGGDLPWE